MSAPPTVPRACWCGQRNLRDYSTDYGMCPTCGTLVSRAPLPAEAFSVRRDEGELYSKDYWLKRQSEHHGLPDLHARARLDLPERCVHWLRHLLSVRLPPGRVLEIGCGHGGYVALLGWAGFEAEGTEMSPWVVEFAKRTFDIQVSAGPIESLPFAAGSFDVIVINDVIEHLPDPLATLGQSARLLKSGGFFVIQTPEYKEHLAYADLRASQDLFLKHMEHNNDEHLFLFSRRSAGLLFDRLGFPCLAFENPVYAYDMFFTASKTPLARQDAGHIAENLAQRASGRLVLALLDKAYESTDRWWAMQRLEAELKTLRREP